MRTTLSLSVLLLCLFTAPAHAGGTLYYLEAPTTFGEGCMNGTCLCPEFWVEGVRGWLSLEPAGRDGAWAVFEVPMLHWWIPVGPQGAAQVVTGSGTYWIDRAEGVQRLAVEVSIDGDPDVLLDSGVVALDPADPVDGVLKERCERAVIFRTGDENTVMGAEQVIQPVRGIGLAVLGLLVRIVDRHRIVRERDLGNLQVRQHEGFLHGGGKRGVVGTAARGAGKAEESGSCHGWGTFLFCKNGAVPRACASGRHPVPADKGRNRSDIKHERPARRPVRANGKKKARNPRGSGTVHALANGLCKAQW